MTAHGTPEGPAGGSPPVPGGSAGGETVPSLSAARLWAASRFPYLATGLFGARVTAAPGIATVAVDEGWRLHADPDLASGWTPGAVRQRSGPPRVPPAAIPWGTGRRGRCGPR